MASPVAVFSLHRMSSNFHPTIFVQPATKRVVRKTCTAVCAATTACATVANKTNANATASLLRLNHGLRFSPAGVRSSTD